MATGESKLDGDNGDKHFFTLTKGKFFAEVGTAVVLKVVVAMVDVAASKTLTVASYQQTSRSQLMPSHHMMALVISSRWVAIFEKIIQTSELFRIEWNDQFPPALFI